MQEVKFDRRYTYGIADNISSSHPNTIYFTTDSQTIMLGGKKYGLTPLDALDIADTKAAIETTSQTALAALQSAQSAQQSAQQTADYFYNVYSIIGSLGDDTDAAIISRVGVLETNVNTINSEKVTSWSSSTGSDINYPSEKLVKTEIDAITPDFLTNTEIDDLWYVYGILGSV